MKSFVVGLLTILILTIVGFYTFKATTKFINQSTPSPSSSAIASASADPTLAPSPSPSQVPTAIYTPVVKGTSTTKTVTTTTTSHLTLTLVKTSACPISYMTEVKDIEGPLTLEYSLKDGYSFGITIWKNDGNELLSNTTYSGSSGQIKTISGVDYMKVRIESKSCASNNENWLTLTAKR